MGPEKFLPGHACICADLYALQYMGHVCLDKVLTTCPCNFEDCTGHIFVQYRLNAIINHYTCTKIVWCHVNGVGIKRGNGIRNAERNGGSGFQKRIPQMRIKRGFRKWG